MKRFLSTLVLMIAGVLSAASAAAQITAVPPNVISTNNRPMVMLSASKDFTMFWRAYTDFNDIDFDGKVDRTYVYNFKYYGYFDPGKCYSYSSTNGRFEPKRIADANYYCTAGQSEWSGNFLNWVSMSRIDILRKVLYGGMRYADTADATTLELSFVPRNSQAIVKYYNGSDLNRLTPFNDAAVLSKGVTFCRRPAENTGVSHTGTFTPEIRAAVGNLILWNMTEVKTCNWSTEGGYSWQAPTITFLNNNYVTPAGDLARNNLDHQHLTSVPAKTDYNSSYTARVQACVSTLLGGERCKNYGTIGVPKYKPVGLLHEFGESAKSGVEAARAEFGLLMGSYDNNLQGGVLRKNMSQINDEIDPATGVFVTPAVGSGGIIRSFNEITLYGYNVNTGNFDQTCYSDAITNGQCSSWGNPVSELLLESLRYYAGKAGAYEPGTKDTNVGLPSVTTRTDPLKANPVIGLSNRSTLYGQPICRALNMLTVTSGASSYDSDVASFTTDLGSTSTAAALTNIIGDREGITGTMRLIGQVSGGSGAYDNDYLCTAKTITGLGNAIGVCSDGPNFKGTYLGAGIAHYANTHKIRSDITAVPSDAPGNALMVRNYGVSMSGGVATVEIPLPNGKKVFITPASQDQQGRTTAATALPANMVDFKYLSLADDQKSGSALVLWQHNMLGEDQDQDQLQSLRWVLDGTSLKVFTQAVEANTGSANPMATGYTLVGTDSDGVHLHSSINNYVTSELSVDVSTALYNGAVQGTTGEGCTLDSRSLCVVVDGRYIRGETSKTYTATGATDALIREPLWYMSKYGGFNYDPNANVEGAATLIEYPTAANRPAWDTKRADGRACGGSTGLSCSDGEPDNYFVARSPELLENSLREILAKIVASSNASPAVATGQLRAGDLKYVAKFDPTDGHGELSAFAIDATSGLFLTTPSWGAHTELTKTASISRAVITNNGAAGAAFSWSGIDNSKQAVLKSGITDATAGPIFGQAMLRWLRGDTSDQSNFRIRSAASVMGPIVNSNPMVQGAPSANYFGTAFAGYGEFATTWRTRTNLLWVGAGDGMLHAFTAGTSGGTPVMSYVPEPIFSRLPDWASPSTPAVQAYVDGSPFVGDVKISSDWATYLFSSLGRGGKGIFALDVTDPATLNVEATAVNAFKWQFTSADDADLGYVLSEPTISRFSNQPGQIARMNNGKFAALFGNGVQSTTGKAVLYILFADGPLAGNWAGQYVKLTADTGTGNGLSQPIWLDENNDGIADAIYAGDLKGNLWKFNVGNTDPANWAVAYAGKPLFTAQDAAGNALPITGAPEYRFHPLGGVLVNIATGKSVTSGDFPNFVNTNTVFGIWDNPTFATMSSTDLDAELPRTLSQLTLRTLNNVSETDTLNRYVTGSVMDWTTKKGWYMPFNVSSEMSISNMAMANGQVVAVSVSPALAKVRSTDPDPCTVTPVPRLTALDPITGFPSGLLGEVDITNPQTSVVTTYPLVSIGINDQKVRVTKDAVGAGSSSVEAGTCSNGKLNCSRIVGENTDKGLSSANTNARIFWREIPGLKTRTN